MSGVEALIALGIIANTVGVIDFTSKIIGRIKDTGENVQNVPKAFRDVQSTLPLLSHALKQTQRRIETRALDEEACSALKPVLHDCSSDISELNGIFDKCLPKDGSSRLHRGWKAAISVRQDKKVEEISELIQKRVQFLTYYHVAAPQSSATATNVLSAEIEAMHIANERSPKIYSMIPVQCGNRDIANEVGIQGCNDPEVDILQKVKDWFEGEASGKWLLIYDNVDDIDLMYGQQHGRLAAYIPRSNCGSIIMTTRNRQIGIKFATAMNTISLSDLTEADSINLMTTKLGESNPEDEPELKQLVRVLGGIPLAIIQAISFIQENGTTPTRYLELYEKDDSNRAELLSQDFEDDTRDPELKNPIASTWIVTFDYMKAHQPLAADTLCLMSMFDAQAIPEAFISKIAGGDSASPTAAERTVGVLQAYSLISLRHDTSANAPHKQVGRTFDLHRLVRLVTRNWLTEWSYRDRWLARAIDVMSFRYDEIKTLDYEIQYKVNLQYMPHALILVSSPPLCLQEDEGVYVPEVFSGQTITNDHAEDGAICPSCTANILGSMIDKHLSAYRCLRMTQKAVAIYNLYLDRDHVATVLLRKEEAICLDYLGDFSGAENIHQEVFVGYESKLGSSNRSTLRAGLELANNLKLQAKYDEAERLLLRLEFTACQEYHQADSLTIETMQALSDNMIDQGRSEEALEKYSEISRLVNTIKSQLDLARNYAKSRQYSSAETLLLNLLKDEDELRKNLRLDDVWEELAEVYFRQRLFDKAESLPRQVLIYRQRAFGKDHNVSGSEFVLIIYVLLGQVWIRSVTHHSTLENLGMLHIRPHFGDQYVISCRSRKTRLPLMTLGLLADTLFAMLYLAFTLYRLGPENYHEVESLALKGKELHSAVPVLSIFAAWCLAKVWLRLGKYDDAKKLALQFGHSTLAAQYANHIPWVKLLEDVWGINLDGTYTNESDCLDPHDTADRVLDGHDQNETIW
ncbi:MAG: hypothetical protein Q9198_001861 [Flavoplaca austrocitrina]